MKQKKIAILLILLLLIASFSIPYYLKNCKAETLPRFYVDDDAESSWYLEDEHFSSIQTAINQADAYDRILVYAGTYSENIVINKTGISLFGEDKSLVTISGGDTGDVIKITEQNVDISSFTITNSGSNSIDALIKINAGKSIITDNILTSGSNGIYIKNCSETTIYFNNISDCGKNGVYIENSIENIIQQVEISDIDENGIFLKNVSEDTTITYTDIESCDLNGIFSYRCSNDTISYCNIKNNDKHGVHFNYSCNENTLTNNNISGNDKNGIYLNDHSRRNTINNNDFYLNCQDATGYYTYAGIRIENSSSNTLGNNNIKNNYFYGAMIVGDSNILHNSTINNNDQHGVFLFGDYNNKIYDNTINANTKSGIRAYNSTEDEVTRNEISNNNRGIYLNYYSTGNEIWNNYFHDNTVNAYDISPDNNIWNKTIYSGYNIVNGNGKNVAGNYWDDFDETSEGAVESINDGITDGSKSIEIQTFDYLPICDILSPTIQNVDVSPSSQSVGGYTYISADITDNTEIKDVRLIITNPSGSTSNFSILQNNTGSSYYCNKQFSTVGIYSYTIKAKDPMNWETSTSDNFEIKEGTAPSITDNSPGTGEAGTGFVFNATVTDDTDSADEITVKVIWSHGDNSGNSTMVKTQGNYFRYSAQLDNSVSSLSYYFYTNDSCGNTRTTSSTTVEITDETQPTITINDYEYESDGYIHTYEISTTITDNAEVVKSYIEYWINNGTHNTAEMDKNGNKYEKTIYLKNADDVVYCIINATDSSGNVIDTKNPYADAKGAYTGVISHSVNFDGSDSFDLDGNIIIYNWDFGDGSTGTGETIEHTYLTNGIFDVTLTVTDNDELTDTDTTTATIVKADKTEPSATTINKIEEDYNVELSELFYCYDIDGDEEEDRFYDPNNVLETVHSGSINIDGNICFILKPKSVSSIFLWDVTEDAIISVNSNIVIKSLEEDSTKEKIFVNFSITKTQGWIYFERDDKYPDSDLKVYADNIEIPTDRFWRENNKIYVLDDPEVNYSFVYNKTASYGVLKWMTFNPTKDDASINNPINISIENPTITIEYNIAITINEAKFYDWSLKKETDIVNDLETSDNKIYIFTPKDISPGMYDIVIIAEDSEGNIWTNASYYLFYSPAGDTESKIDIISILPFIGLIAGGFVALYLFMRYKHITLESFIYFKNKKIIPFFKPLVFGPLRIDIKEKNIKKAEIYVNGKLKETITEPPYTWDFNEKGFIMPKIETKIYDNKGNSNSTGEMTFFILNGPKFFR